MIYTVVDFVAAILVICEFLLLGWVSAGASYLGLSVCGILLTCWGCCLLAAWFVVVLCLICLFVVLFCVLSFDVLFGF